MRRATVLTAILSSCATVAPGPGSDRPSGRRFERVWTGAFNATLGP